MVAIARIQSLWVEVTTSEKLWATKGQVTYEWCDRDAVRGTAVDILAVYDTGKVDDGLDEGWLQWSAEHIVGVCHLKGPAEPMRAADILGSFSGLLLAWRRENFGLR